MLSYTAHIGQCLWLKFMPRNLKFKLITFTYTGFFLQQGSHISGKNERIHCSLNINTETGRLSARRPNLQVQISLTSNRSCIREHAKWAPPLNKKKERKAKRGKKQEIETSPLQDSKPCSTLELYFASIFCTNVNIAASSRS